MSVEDRLVRDQFIAGLLDSSLLKKLCHTCDLMLDKALPHARLHEDTEQKNVKEKTSYLGQSTLMQRTQAGKKAVT